MELDQLYVHVELCEALLEDFLQRPDLLQEQSNLEGLLLVAESLLAYLVQIEALIPAVYPRIQVLVNGVIGCMREVSVIRDKKTIKYVGEEDPNYSSVRGSLLNCFTPTFRLSI